MIILQSIEFCIIRKLFLDFKINSILKLRCKWVFDGGKILLLQILFLNEFDIIFRLLTRIVITIIREHLRRSRTDLSNWIAFQNNVIMLEHIIAYIITQNICVFLTAHYALLIQNYFSALRYWILSIFELVLFVMFIFEYRILRLDLRYFIRL